MLLLPFILAVTVTTVFAIPMQINQLIQKVGKSQGQGDDGESGEGEDNRGPRPEENEIVMCNMTSPVSFTDIGIVDSTSVCGDTARSYYNSTLQGDTRVVSTSGIPYHDHVPKNPNEACEKWSYMKVPLNPTKGTEFRASILGPVGMSVSGAFFFNHLGGSRAVGVDDVAYYTEGNSFDPCHGHADPFNQYHYHQIPVCIPGWDTCGLMGYLHDGFPVYGLNCTGNDGNKLTSCYSLPSGADEDDTSSYVYNSTAGCDLDQANGYDFGGDKGYGYVFTLAYPFIMPGYYGTTKANLCYI